MVSTPLDGSRARTLVLMRHAKSDWSGDEPDRDRPIGGRGTRQAAEAGSWLDAHLPGLDLVVTSPARRATQTWQTASREYAGSPRVQVDERIYAAYDDGMLAVLREVGDDVASVLMVGHNPGVDELVTRLTGERVDMVTSALAVLGLPDSWDALERGACRLIAHGRPPG